MDRIEAMRSFVQVVNTGSFTRAAAALGCQKGRVSDQVARLEKLLGVSLLTRTTRAVAPTPEGLQYARKATAILMQLDEAETALRLRSRSPQGLLKVEVPSALGSLVVVPNLPSFLNLYPRISLDLGCTDRRSDLVREGVDCVVRGGLLPDSSLVCRKLCDLESALYASPAYLGRVGIPLTPADLDRHEQVGFRNPTGTNAREPVRLTRQGQEVLVDLPARLIVTDIETKLQAGLAGMGIVYLTNFTVAQHLQAGTLVRVLPDWHGHSLPLNLLAPGNRFRTARVQAFMDWMQDLLRRIMAPR